jgi:hypothetical protein
LRRFVIFCLDKLWQPWFPKNLLHIVDEEKCYRRIPPDAVLGEFVTPAAFAFPNASCLRSRWSDPPDALHPKACDGRDFTHFGVVALAVDAIRKEFKIITPERSLSLLFDVLPEPITGCFAHSEINDGGVLPGDVRFASDQLDDKQRAKVRANFAYRCQLVIAPRS